MALISSGTGGDKIAAGTTGQRPTVTAADAGMIRFNKTEGYMERWDGSTWDRMGGGGASVHVGEPSSLSSLSPELGDLWYNTVDGMLYVYYTDANSSQWVDCSPPDGEGQSAAEPIANPSGYKNVIINGNLLINQRGVTYAAAANNKYWADRWKKVPGGMTQIIENGFYYPSTVYTLSGTNVTTQQITSPASGNWTLPSIASNATKVQLEVGTVATAYEVKPPDTELEMCKRYFQLVPNAFSGQIQVGTSYVSISIMTEMRIMPTIDSPTKNQPVTLGNAPGFYGRNRLDAGSSPSSLYIYAQAINLTNGGGWFDLWSCDAEL